MARAVLRRVDITLLRDKSTTDNTQVPIAGGRIDFYRQGATASETKTIPSTGTLRPLERSRPWLRVRAEPI